MYLCNHGKIKQYKIKEKDAKKSIEALQFFATGLTEGALVHKLQGQIFKSQGFSKLGQKYIDHFNEEMEWVEKFYDRIMDLGGRAEERRRYRVARALQVGTCCKMKKEGCDPPFIV